MRVVLAVAGGLLLAWLVLLVGLAVARPRGSTLTDALRLLPDLVGLLRRLARDPALPRSVRVTLWLLLGYLLVPIDLVPDFIPVLGYLDDVILLPACIWLAVRLLPPDVVADSRAKADAWMATEGRKPVSKAGAALVVALWLAIAAAGWWWWRQR